MGLHPQLLPMACLPDPPAAQPPAALGPAGCAGSTSNMPQMSLLVSVHLALAHRCLDAALMPAFAVGSGRRLPLSCTSSELQAALQTTGLEQIACCLRLSVSATGLLAVMG